MTEEDLYRELGVDRDATPEEIKAAFRRAAKETHPDAGGEDGAFQRKNRAYLILRNPKRRSEYDRTGRVDEEVDNREAQIRQLMSEVLAAVIQDTELGPDPRTKPLMGMIAGVIEGVRVGLNQGIAKHKAERDRIAKVKGRFVPRTPDNRKDVLLIERLLDAQIAVLDHTIAEHEAKLTVIDEAMTRFKDVGYEQERPEPRPGPWFTQTMVPIQGLNIQGNDDLDNLIAQLGLKYRP